MASDKELSDDLAKIASDIQVSDISVVNPSGKVVIDKAIFIDIYNLLSKLTGKASNDGESFTKTTINSVKLLSDGNGEKYLADSGLYQTILDMDVSMSVKDSPSMDAFARLRVSNPETIFDSKQIFDNAPLFWDDQQISGAGTTSTHNPNTASTVMGVADSTVGRRIRQTFMRFNYQPGKSQLVLMTGTLGRTGGGNGITRCMGMYDDKNGIYAEDDQGTVKLCIRSFVTGAAVNNKIPQSEWNLDRLNGFGPSGYTFSASNSQILIFDFEWLGVGRVRIGFVFNGIPVYCHEFNHANNLEGVYMSTPNLPLRYEIENDGFGVASELEHICASVMSEGGVVDTGIVSSVNLGIATVNANVVGAYYAIVGLRLKSTHLGATIKILTGSLMALTNDDFLWELRFNPAVAGTFAYADKADSAVQVALGNTTSNPSPNTVTGGELIDSGYVVGNSTKSSVFKNAKLLGSAISGTPDNVVLCITPLTSNLDITGSLTWREGS